MKKKKEFTDFKGNPAARFGDWQKAQKEWICENGAAAEKSWLWALNSIFY